MAEKKKKAQYRVYLNSCYLAEIHLLLQGYVPVSLVVINVTAGE
jgi:hypothetical protein